MSSFSNEGLVDSMLKNDGSVQRINEEPMNLKLIPFGNKVG